MNDKNKNIPDCARQLLKNILLLWVLLIISNFAVKAQQDPQFSLNQNNQMTVNPGYAGSTGFINLSVLNRYQWVGFPGAPVTIVFNVDGMLHLVGKNDGLGLSIVNDVIGFEKNTSLGLNYSWRTKVANGTLGSGIYLGAINRVLNMSVIKWGDLKDGSDPLLPVNEVNGVMADLGAGLYYQQNSSYLAVSVRHINQATLSFNESGRYLLKRHYYMSGGHTLKMTNEKIVALPSVYFKTDAITWQADLNVTILYDKRFWFGLGYRLEDAIVVSIGSELGNGIKFGYSYDISTSTLSRYNAGSHEFFLAYSVLLNKKRKYAYKSVRFL